MPNKLAEKKSGLKKSSGYRLASDRDKAQYQSTGHIQQVEEVLKQKHSKSSPPFLTFFRKEFEFTATDYQKQV